MQNNYTNKFRWLMGSIGLSLLMAFSAVNANAQITGTIFVDTVLTYTPITGGTVISATCADDDAGYPLQPIGFNFPWNGGSFTQIGISPNGYMSLGGLTVNSYSPLTTVQNVGNIISALGADLHGKGVPCGEVRIQTIGTAPNRTCVVQWSNISRYLNSNNTLDTFNFQIRLRETGFVDIVYGYMAVPSAGNYQVGILGTNLADFSTRTGTFDANSSAGLANNATMPMSATNKPVSGLTYTWSFPPQVYNSSTTVSAPGNTVARGGINQTIARVEVNIGGISSPLSLSQLNLSTAGSTNTANISAAKVFYTGNSTTFSPTTQFGTTVNSPGATFNVTGSQTLVSGMNYFWVVYDIAPTATLLQVVDAECSGMTISGISYIPTVTAPPGNKTIGTSLTGTYTIGASGNYTTITTAMADLSNLGVSNSVTFNLIDPLYNTATGEIFPITVTPYAGMSPIRPVTIRPAFTNSPLISDSATSMFIFDGAKYIMIDGRWVGDANNNLTIENRSNGATHTVIRYVNDATANTLRNTNIRGANNSTNTTAPVFGSVYIGNSNRAIPVGNDSIVIRGNYFARFNNSPYTKAVVSDGQSAVFQNDACVIDSNNFNGFTQNGIFVTLNNSGNGSNWRINANSFYDTAVTTSTNNIVCINFNPSTNSNSNGNIISGNFIGGNAPQAPTAAGQRWVITSSIGFTGILSSGGSGAGTQITNNTVRSLRLMNTSTATSIGINPINPGVVSVTNNTIGDLADTNSIFSTANALFVGINATTTNDVVISNNTISNLNMAGTGTSCASRGIVVTNGSNNFSTVSNNTIRAMSTRSASTGTVTIAPWIGIQMGSFSPNQIVTNNTIGGSNAADSCSIYYTPVIVGEAPPVLGPGRMIGILANNGTNTINNNSVRSLFSQSTSANTVNSSANIIGILASTGSNGNLIQNNTLDSFILRTPAVSATIAGIVLTSGGTNTSNNSIGDFYSQGISTSANASAAITGINASASTPQIVTNNTIFNFDNASNTGNQMAGIVFTAGSGHIYAGNTIRNLRSNSTATTSIVGINNVSGGLNNLIERNTIHSLVSYSAGTGTPGLFGINYSGSTTIVGNTNNLISRNIIHSFNVDNSGTASATITGIQISNGNVNTYNNVIRLGRDTSGTPLTRLGTYRGIFLNTSGNIQNRIMHNTVHLETAPATGTGTSAVLDFAGTATGAGFTDVRNNILVNNTANAGGTGNQYIIRSGGTSLLGFTLNSNMYSMAATVTNFVGRVNALDYATLANWQAIALMDGASSFATPSFVNATGDFASVNMQLTASNNSERGGDIAVAALVTNDFNGLLRDTLSAADLGAFGQLAAISADVNAPVINLTSLSTSSPANRTFTATITDGGGLPQDTNKLPRVYFRKLLGGLWFSSIGTLTSGNRFNGTWTFTINTSIMGGVAPGDSVFYYVIAQDSLANNVNTNGMFATATSVTSVSSHPTNPASYRISDPLPLSINVGAGQTYATLTGIGGLFEAINNGFLQGNTTVNIVSDITEPATVTLNRWLEVGAGGYTLTIRPDGFTQRIISTSSVNTNGMITLNNVNGFRMLGWATTGLNTDTNLILRASNTSTPAISLINGGANDTLVNVILESRISSTSSGTIFVQATNLPATNGLTNMLVQNCTFRQDLTSATANFPTNGIFMAANAPRLNTNINITRSFFYNNANQGINISNGGGNGYSITHNHFFFNALATFTTSYQAINFNVGQLSDNNNVSNNWIGGTAPFTGGSRWTTSNQFVGIAASAGIITGTNVNNNVVTNITVTGTSGMTGIFVTGASAIYLVNGNRIGSLDPVNSIQFTSTSNSRLQGINAGNTGNITMTNDTVVNILNQGVGATAGITGILSSGFASNNVTVISNNFISNLVLTASTNTSIAGTSTALLGIFNQNSSLSQTFANNTVQSLVNSNIAAHQTVGIMTTAGANNITNNTVRGILSSTSNANQAFPTNWSNSIAMGVIGISNHSTSSGIQLVANNTVDSIACNNAAANVTFGISVGGGFGSQTQALIRNNTVSNLYSQSTLAAGNPVFTTQVATPALVGIFSSNPSPNQEIVDNDVRNLNHLSNSSSAIIGIACSHSTAFNGNNSFVSRNFVHSIRSTAVSPNLPIIAGIWNMAGIGTYSNNMIRLGIDSSATLDTSARVTRGIFQDPINTNANRYYHNTILIAGTPASGAASVLSAGIQIGSAIPTITGLVNVVDIRNNIIANRVNSVAPALSRNYGIRLVDSNNVISNYNLFNITGGNGFIAGINTVDYTSLRNALGSWSSITRLDMNSGSGDPNFVPDALGSAAVASLQLLGTNPAEASGDPSLASVVTDDNSGTSRSSNTPTDIGAHAENFNLSPDVFAPVITFTPLVNSGTLSGSRPFNNVSITDNNGIPLTGANRPRVYYSKDGTTWFSVGSSSITGTSKNATANFTIDYAPIAPLASTDTIRYYVIAQDNAGNIMSNAPNVIATDVNTVTTHPSSVNTYNFLPIIAANSVFTVGSSSTYTSLTGPGGFFEFINSRTLGGNIFADITSDLLNEPGTTALNTFAEDGAGAGTFTLTIRPVSGTTSAYTIQGNAANTLINLNGASRVKITGVPVGGATTSRFLRFRNNNTTASTISIRNGAQGVRLNNLILEGGNTSASSGIVSLEVLTGTVPCSFDTITGCLFDYNSTIGLPNGLTTFQLFSNGGVGVLNANNVIDNNEFANPLVSGLVLGNNNGPNWRITNNSFYFNLPITPTTANLFPVQLVPSINANNYTISGNFVGGSAAQCGGTPWSTNSNNANFSGMVINLGTGAVSNITNNTVSNISFTNTGTPVFNGLNVTGGDVSITNNTIGSTTVNNSIVYAHSNTHNGIVYSGVNGAVVNNNTVAGINVGVAGQSATFNAIAINNGGVSAINGNTIGSALANSIVNNGTGSITALNIATIPVNLVLNYTANNNTIRNLSMPGNQSSIFVRGIFAGTGANPTISGNTISNLTTNSSNIATTFTGMAVSGIALAPFSTVVPVVRGNTISGLRALNTSNSVTPHVSGIVLGGGQNSVITANRIFDLTNASTSTSVLPTPSVAGINISSGSVNAFVTNNQVTLGSGATTNTQFIGIWLNLSSTSFTLNAAHNSVLITGSVTSGNQNSYAFMRGNNTLSEMATFLNLRNNIFANNRAGGTGNHFVIANQTSSPTNNTWVASASQYNLLVSSNTNAIGQWGTSATNYTNWIANATSDERSYYMQSGTNAGQLNLANLFTSTSNGNLGIQAANVEAWYVFGKGIAGSAVNNLNADFAGSIRGTTLGFGNTLGSIQMASTPSLAPPAAIASAAPAANSTVNYTFASRPVATINWGTSAPTSATLLNFTGVTAPNQPSGNNANHYMRVDLAGGATPYNYGVVYNFDPAILGSVSNATNLRLSTQTTGSTLGNPVWATQVSSTVNAVAGTATNAGLTTSLANMFFTVTETNAPPIVNSFTPSLIHVGGSITIRGRNFIGTTSLTFANGIVQNTFTIVNDTTITTTVPTGTVNGVVSATNANGTGTSTATLSILQAPSISAFSPASGTIGTLVTINGSNFVNITTVQFNSVNATSFTVVNATTITAVVPSVASGNITVTNAAGTATSATAFTVFAAPTVTSFAPTSGPAGTNVTITGTNFNAITAVRFNGVDASYSVNSTTSISVIVPSTATTGTISVINGSGTGTSATNFTVVLLPTITAISPSSGGVGSIVTISGSNFTGATAVAFNGTAASSFTVNNAGQITATVATATTTGAVTVTTPAGIATGPNFTVISDLVVSTATGVTGTFNNITVTSTGFATLTGSLTALGNVVIQTGGRVNFGTNILSGNGNFTAQAATRLITANATGFTATGGVSGSIQTAGTRTYAATTTVEFNGTGSQMIGDGITTVDTLIINNAAGVSLNGNLTVNHSLNFTAGSLTIGNNNITIGASGNIVGASAANYVVTNGNGVLRRTVTNNATNVTFPIGTTSYTPAQVQLTVGSTADVFGVRAFNGVFTTGNNSGVPFTTNVVDRTWFVSEAVTGGSVATVTLAWDDSVALSFNNASCALARHNGTAYGWIGVPPISFAAAGLSAGQRTRSVSNLSIFGHLAVGDNLSTLPVEMLSFTAKANNNDVALDWTTAMEMDNKGFDVERSVDGRTFEAINFIEGKGNSNAVVNYNFIDANAFAKNNTNVLYYRLKQLDNNGDFTYTNIVKVVRGSDDITTLSAYPNPFTQSYAISFDANTEGEATIVMVDIQGKVVSQQSNVVTKGRNTLEVTNIDQLQAGIYFARLTVNDETHVIKVVKH